MNTKLVTIDIMELATIYGGAENTDKDDKKKAAWDGSVRGLVEDKKDDNKRAAWERSLRSLVE